MIATPLSSWVESTTADNAVATATRAAPSGGISHYITSVSGSFSATVSGATLTLKQGTTEVARWNVYDSFSLSFSSPIKLDPGDAANLELAASGTLGNIGAVNMTGYTI